MSLSRNPSGSARSAAQTAACPAPYTLTKVCRPLSMALNTRTISPSHRPDEIEANRLRHCVADVAHLKSRHKNQTSSMFPPHPYHSFSFLTSAFSSLGRTVMARYESNRFRISWRSELSEDGNSLKHLQHLHILRLFHVSLTKGPLYRWFFLSACFCPPRRPLPAACLQTYIRGSGAGTVQALQNETEFTVSLAMSGSGGAKVGTQRI